MSPAYALLAALSLAAIVPAAAEPILWDLLISADAGSLPLEAGQRLQVSGIVTDHAGESIAGAMVQIRGEYGTVTVATLQNGTFTHEFAESNLLPGEYILNIRATSQDGKVGLGSTTFRVAGELSAYSHTQKLLDTDEARMYLAADPASLRGDTTGQALHSYYQELHERFLKEKKVQDTLDAEEARLAGLRDLAKEGERDVIEEANPGAGKFDGHSYEVFIGKIDPDYRDAFVKQVNFTNSVFDAAQLEMDRILSEGGSYEEARAAYLEILTVPRSLMEQVAYGTPEAEPAKRNIITNQTTTSNQTAVPVPKAPIPQGASVFIGGTDIRIGVSGSSVYVTINGTQAELVVNGTRIIQIK